VRCWEGTSDRRERIMLRPIREESTPHRIYADGMRVYLAPGTSMSALVTERATVGDGPPMTLAAVIASVRHRTPARMRSVARVFAFTGETRGPCVSVAYDL
jgi:hypothetical protein